MSYHTRLRDEKRLKKQPKEEPLYVLSSNTKTGVSLNLPVMNCRPTKRCAADCYACLGPIAWDKSIKRALAVDGMLRVGEIKGLEWECQRYRDVRLCGSGDLTCAHVPALLKLARQCPSTTFWGFTRRREVAQALNKKRKNLSIILSLDSTSKDQRLAGYRGPLAYGPTRPGDVVPKDPRIVVVFPAHKLGWLVKGIPEHAKDCPAARKIGHLMACPRCRRCHKPYRLLARRKCG